MIPFSSCAFNVRGSYAHFNFFPYKVPLNKNVNALHLYCTFIRHKYLCEDHSMAQAVISLYSSNTKLFWRTSCFFQKGQSSGIARNTSRISRFWGYSLKFSPRNLGAWHSLARQKRAIRESFLPRKFPAIQYHTYQSVWVAVGDKPCQENKRLNSKFKDPFTVTVTKGKLIVVGCFPKKIFAFCSVLVDKAGQFSVFGYAARQQCAQVSLTYRKQIFEGRNF